MNNQVSKPTSGCASNQREQHAFCEPLLKQANSGGAQRRPDRKLVSSPRAAGKYEVGHVGAGD